MSDVERLAEALAQRNQWGGLYVASAKTRERLAEQLAPLLAEVRREGQAEGPVAHVATEYALANDVGHGMILATSPSRSPRWNETTTLEEAAERWYPGAVVVTRTVTTFEPVVTEWSRAVPVSRADTEEGQV